MELTVKLRYSGKLVRDGSFDLDHTIAALTGFSTAYRKVAFAKQVETPQDIRLADLKKGSAAFVLHVGTLMAENKDVLAGTGAALVIVRTVLEIIKITKHAEGADPKVRIGGDQDIRISNSKNVTINVSHDSFHIYKEGVIRQDLSKLVEPLDTGKVDRLELSASDKQNEASESVSSREKAFFGYIPKEVTETKEMILEGRLFSLNTEINRGSLRLPNGDRVGYRFKTAHPEKFYAYVLRKGLVRVKCIAHLDENLKPVHIDITDIEAVDQELPFD